MKRAAILFAFTLSTAAGAGEPAVNRWTRLPDAFPGGYNYSPVVWAPDRGQLLHWGAVRHANGIKPGNDVRSFDAAALKWTGDYPSDPKQSWGIVGGGSGSAISYCGKGKMLESGRPQAAMIVNAACYDTRRKRVVVSMPGLMAAYDPAARTWTDLKATTELHGKTLPGGPPVYGAGMCYDPVNDEIVMFPHFGAQSADMREATGRISGHLGTLRYSSESNTWKRVGSELGAPEVRKARAAVVALLGKISPALDSVWTARHGKDGAALADAGKKLGECADGCGELGSRASSAATALKTASAKAASDPAAALEAGTRAVWALEGLLEKELAVEPTVRSVAPMVYDSRNQVIVLFGGDSGRIRPDLEKREQHIAGDRKLDDTWLYDVRTRQWSDASQPERPPAQQAPNLVYDPDSGQCLLVTVTGNRWDKRVPRVVTVWSFDAAERKWAKRAEQPWDGEITDWYSLGLDAKQKLLVLAQTANADQQTWVMKLDAKSMPSEPAPAAAPLPAETPTTIPPDDPAWVAQLRGLPANTWTEAKPPRDAARRDWGNIACDAVRGWMVFFGGGHSTYQGTDVAVYVVGANRWIHQAGGHNDSLPPVGWGGYHMAARGSNNAGHMRNQYVAVDGRMFTNTGFGAQLKPRDGAIFTETEIVSLPEKPHAWFYDVDRGGVWRQLPTEIDGELPEPSRGSRGARPLVVDPAGKVYHLDLWAANRYSNVTERAGVYCYDVYERRTTIRSIPAPWPLRPPESRPYCMLPDRNQIFFQDCDPKKSVFRTWVYDVKANRFVELKPPGQPQGKAAGVAYLADQGAVFAAIDVGGRKFEQWAYSLERNRWARLPAEGKIGFKAPYAQFDYVEKYGVLVNYDNRTYVMRPDVAGLKWE